jgi:ribA/ribD-fused uncharacterized protein
MGERMRDMIDRFDGTEYAFLSNFYYSPIVMPDWHPAAGKVAQTIEHAFQSAKTDDVAQARLVLCSSSPGQAKRIGRRVRIRDGWDEGRDVVMLALVKLKFAPGSELAEKLLATDDAPLVEGNTWGDTYWGVSGGVGENRLGQILMGVRESLRSIQRVA